MASDVSISTQLTRAWIRHGKTMDGMKSKQSMQWFNKYIQDKFSTVSFNKLKADGQLVMRPKPGQLVTYRYDAKHKDTLPVWDAFPLVLVISVDKTSWKGLSLHYLPPSHRMNLMMMLLKAAENAIGERARLTAIGSVLKSVTSVYGSIIKMYLQEHLMTPVLNVDFPAWEQVIFLPTARFQHN